MKKERERETGTERETGKERKKKERQNTTQNSKFLKLFIISEKACLHSSFLYLHHSVQ